MDILNLADWSVLTTDESEYDYRFSVEYKSDRVVCPGCGSVDDHYGHGKLPQLIMDLPIHAKRVGLEVQRKRYQCRSCHKTFMQHLPDVDETRWATNRLVGYIENESLKRTFTSIADDVGVNEKTIRNIFREYIARLEASVEFITPEWLGIDELTLMKRPRCIITNVKERSVIELMETRNKPEVAARIRSMEDRRRIRLVTMDMWQPYRDAVRTELPGAQIVVDKFHIQRMANQALEVVRKQIRGELTDRQRRQLMHDRFILLRRRQELEPKDRLKLEAWTRYSRV